jgi:hypothetical protein
VSDPRPPAAPLDASELELAALYALAALSPEEMQDVERDYEERASFWAEVRSLQDAAALLAESGPRARPGRDLWPSIRARVRSSGDSLPKALVQVPKAQAQIWKHWRADARAPWIQRQDETSFEPTAIQGVSVRRLFVDEDADRVTMLVRMTAGTSYPAHRHGGAEECYVLEGDLWIGDATEMHAGDYHYQRMAAGSLHERQSTRAGCLLLVTSSRRDELLG